MVYAAEIWEYFRDSMKVFFVLESITYASAFIIPFYSFLLCRLYLLKTLNFPHSFFVVLNFLSDRIP